VPDEFIGLAAVVLIFAIPIVAILAHHQQKMAKMIHGERPANLDALMSEVQRLRTEVADLKETVHANVLAAELSSVPPPLQDRLESTNDA